MPHLFWFIKPSVFGFFNFTSSFRGRMEISLCFTFTPIFIFFLASSHFKHFQRSFDWFKSVLNSSHLLNFLCDSISKTTGKLPIFGVGIGSVQESEMGFDINVMLILQHRSSLCNSPLLHKRFAIGYKTIMRVCGCKGPFSFLNSFLLFIFLYFFSLIDQLHIFLCISS